MKDLILKFLGTVTVEQAIPLVILLFQFLLLLLILYKAQARPDFDAANFLRDENRKESSGRAYGFICLAITSWIMATLTFMKLMSENYLLFFMIVWAGTPVLMELAKRWNGILPFTNGQGPAFPQQQQVYTSQTTTTEQVKVATGTEP